MAERFLKLSTLPENQYAAGAPVILSAGNLLKDTVTGGLFAQLKIKNIAEKSIRAARVRIRCFDTVGDALDADAVQEYLDLAVRSGKEFGQKDAISLPDPSAREVSVEVERVVFSDKSIWEGSGSRIRSWQSSMGSPSAARAGSIPGRRRISGSAPAGTGTGGRAAQTAERKKPRCWRPTVRL